MCLHVNGELVHSRRLSDYEGERLTLFQANKQIKEPT